MMKYICLFAVLFLGQVASAKSYVGISYFAQNSIAKSTSQPTGATSIIGSGVLYPLTYTYATMIGYSWTFNPQFQWTLIPRDSSTYKSSFMLANFPVGSMINNNWQYYFGPGLMYYTIAGSGGTKVLNNGSSTSQFAIPDRSVTTKTITTDLGLSWTDQSQRIAFGTLMEGLLSSSGDRTYHLYFNWSYGFGAY